MARSQHPARPNVVFVFADQWRAQATGFAGDPNVRTPHLDALARRSVRFTAAVAGCPVCSPYRASLMTGQYPLTHGVFLNDVHLSHRATSLADAFAAAGYDTAYIGKWHLNGRGRLHFVPRRDRQGFDFWRACECTHEYNASVYYTDSRRPRTWRGYDAEAQTRAAQGYIRGRARRNRPFLLVLSWGPPHNPYRTAPARFRAMYNPARIQLRPNVPPGARARARADLAGYYAHCTALDQYVGDLLATLHQAGLADSTIFVFTSDHGDMLGSHGQHRKQRPWDESILVPFLLHWPAGLGREPRDVRAPINAPDIMPTLLGLCGLAPPVTVEGLDYSRHLLGAAPPPADAALIACYAPFGEWLRTQGGREYRGVRTEHHTYVRTRRGPWLLYDNHADPCQMENLANRPQHAPVQRRLDRALADILRAQGDGFGPSRDYIRRWGWAVDATGTAATAP